MSLQAIDRRRAGLLFALLLAGLPAATFAEEATVRQEDRRFETKHLDIAAGDVVNFTNEDPFLHQIYTHSPDFRFDSAEQFPGDTVRVAFPTAGTYQVRCGIHPKMLLTVKVGEGARAQ